jgi:tetratricopeptide (TPR) repeat protein
LECATQVDNPTLAYLAGLDYVQASMWIVARLAEGLQHAHQRGILHRDIKPSNILLSADGQPMLLDFNLAHKLDSDQAQAAATLGGTIAYMAPEHLRAVSSRKNPALVRKVDHRSDVYSLGMVLYEMLTGHNPFNQSGSYSPNPLLMDAMAVERSRSAPSLRERRPDVSWGLASIVRKCLAPDQEQRYQRAEHAAEDLQRLLEDRPLKYAPELSRREQLRKWIRRHPRLDSSVSVAVVAALLLFAAGAALVGVRNHLFVTQDQLEATQAQERKRDYEEGTIRALCLVNTVTDLHDHLRQGLAVCEKTLAIYGALQRDDWQEDPNWRRLTEDERLQLAEDTRELLLLLARARTRLALKDGLETRPPQVVLREALTLLDRADSIHGLRPSPALWHDRVYYLTQLGETEAAKTAQAEADRIQPSSARDYYLLAITYIRNGGPQNHAKALTALDQAISRNPRHYWSYLQKGICYQEMGKHDLAAGTFGICIGLWPDFAWGYFNRGYALYQSGTRAEAIDDYTAALHWDPKFVDAYVNRGLVCLELRRYAQALNDFQHAANLGRDDASLHAGLGMALEGLKRYQEADGAFAQMLNGLKTVPEAQRIRILLTYGFAVSTRLPGKAQEAFAAVLLLEPDQPEALYGCAMLLVDQKQPELALSFFDRALKVAPQFHLARRGRAITFARRGNFDLAIKDINWCLEREPASGSMLYAAACITALVAEKSTEDAAVKEAASKALDFLEKAFAHGYGQEVAAHDPDLAGIRNYPTFQLLLEREEQKRTSQ